jgi:hypothetical protein
MPATIIAAVLALAAGFAYVEPLPVPEEFLPDL